MTHTKNEIAPEFLGIHATNFAAGNVSSPRSTLYSSHLSQRIVIKGATEKRIQTGAEKELGKYTFAIKMPEDGTIVHTIDRYPKQIDSNDEEINPETLVIYESAESREYGCFVLTTHCSLHQYFGFPYVYTEEVNRIVPGEFIEKDVIFADSPSKSENGGYCYGRELNVCYMSHPAVSEDGILVSRDVLEHLSFTIYEKRIVEFGRTNFPLNLYGTPAKYQPFPKINEKINDSGLLMALRNYDQDLLPVQQSIYDVMEPDFIFDKGIYVRGKEGRVIDIKIYNDESDMQECPFAIMENVEYYSKALRDYYTSILEIERILRKTAYIKFGVETIQLSPELHRLIVEAHAILSEDVGSKSRQKLNKVYRNEPLDEYRIEFTIEYILIPKEGYKLTDSHGSKGVICQVEEPENMPIDQDGNRADIIMDAGSVNSRMNVGRLYEQYFGACARDLSSQLRKQLKTTCCSYEHAINQMQALCQSDPFSVQYAFDTLIRFFEIISPKQASFYRNLTIEDRNEVLASIIAEGIYIFFPTDNEPEMEDIVIQLEKEFKPTYGPVSYIGSSGKRVITRQPFRIGPMYIMLLEKIADDWSSVSYGRLQSMGVLSTLTRNEKFSQPYRNSAVKVVGEAETRIYVGYMGREAIAELFDINNSPEVNAAVVSSILKAEKPTNIPRAVDRKVMPIGGSKAIQLMMHITTCAGWKPVYEPEDQ